MPSRSPASIVFRSRCPVASTLDLIGDRWTMLLIRDLFLGASRFSELATAPEGIPTNILTTRLRMMEEQGLVTKTAYQEHPKRFAYHLTVKGKALQPVMRALKDWGMQWIPDRSAEPPQAHAGGRRRRPA